MCAHAAGPPKVRAGTELGLKRHGVPREGVPRAGTPGQALEVLGKPWGRCLGGTPEETPEAGGPQGSGDVGGRWVVRPRAFSSPHSEDGRIYINMPGRG